MSTIKLFAVDIDGTLTINGNGTINLDALSKLRYLVKLGYQVIYVTGRSATEAIILSIFGGTTNISIGENGGVITLSPENNILLADKERCVKGYNIIANKIKNVKIKRVFPRLTEVVLERTFDIHEGNKILEENNLDLILVDSNYAYHINEIKINKGYGLEYLLKMNHISPNEVAAIGDSETDIPLFKLCGHSVTFESSQKIVKDNAKYIVEGQNGEGLINAIDLIIAKNLIW